MSKLKATKKTGRKNKPGAGRPKGEPMVRVNIMLPPDALAMLDARGKPRGKVIERLLKLTPTARPAG